VYLLQYFEIFSDGKRKSLNVLATQRMGFFLTTLTASGVASLVHLFLSFSGIFLYHTLSMRYVDVLAKNMMKSAGILRVVE
jgi:hypothetical protein